MSSSALSSMARNSTILRHQSSPPLINLPKELFNLISSYFSNADIKTLRLVCREFKRTFHLHFDRVFISPSKENLEVFLAVANHPKFRLGIKEIIWDDAKFERYFDSAAGLGTLEEEENEEDEAHGDDREPLTERGFENLCQENCYGLGRERVAELQIMTLEQNMALYRTYYDEQQEIIRSGQDVEAFRLGLTAFPALQRVTVTSQVYRINFDKPQYQTPLIRSFPRTFNYPLPWPWLGEGRLSFETNTWDNVKGSYHGINVVVEQLASSENRLIPEFCIDAGFEKTGIYIGYFEEPAPEFENFQRLCERGLRRLDLAINCPSAHGEDFTALSSGLREALAASTTMEHFSFHTNLYTFSGGGLLTPPDPPPGLLGFIPTESWGSLKSLCLSHLLLDHDDFFFISGTTNADS